MNSLSSFHARLYSQAGTVVQAVENVAATVVGGAVGAIQVTADTVGGLVEGTKDKAVEVGHATVDAAGAAANKANELGGQAVQVTADTAIAAKDKVYKCTRTYLVHAMYIRSVCFE